MIVSEVFLVYLMVTAGFMLFGILLYLIAESTKERQWTARMTVLAWLWPVAAAVALVLFVFHAVKAVPQFVRDVLGESDGTHLNN